MDEASVGKREKKSLPFWVLPLSFFAVEVFGFCFLRDSGKPFTAGTLWPLAFGGLWALALTLILRVLPNKLSRWAYGILFFLGYAYAVAQTGYYSIFTEMMWLTDFRYASEGSDYITVIFQFPLLWWISMALLGAAGIWILVRYPRWQKGITVPCICGAAAVLTLVGAFQLPKLTYLGDSSIKYAGSDYGRSHRACGH